MAQGDVVFFDQFLVDAWRKLHDLDNDGLKIGLTDGTTTPSAATADPRWGNGGSTDFSAEECAPGGNYPAGGPVAANGSVALSGGQAVLDSDDPATIAQDASNPTDATWGILYNNTDAGKRAIGFIDLGGAYDMTTGDLDINWGSSIGTANQA